jgi:hypothetical protein
MKTFGIIAEGPTDQIVIQNILVGFFNEPDLTTYINNLQPLKDHTDQMVSKGGWLNVFEYCQSQYFLDALEQNDFLIIQIDSDVCEHKHFDVSRRNPDGESKSDDMLIKDITQRFEQLFISAFDQNRYSLFTDRIIYAICLEEIECWLLPIYFTDKIKAATNNCTHKLNPKITERFGVYINKEDKSNMTPHYWKFSKPYMKYKVLMANAYNNPSLGIFIDTLKEKNITL